MAPNTVRMPATTLSNGTHGDGAGAVTAGLMAAVVTAASRVWLVGAVLVTVVVPGSAAAAVRVCCPLGAVGAMAAVGVTAVAG